jgi:hypothetical protein
MPRRLLCGSGARGRRALCGVRVPQASHSCGLRASSSWEQWAPVREAKAKSDTRRKAGLLGPEVEVYRVWLTHRGYTPGTARNMLKDLGQVGVWLSAEGLEPAQFDEERASVFLAARRRAGHRCVPGPRAMVRRCLRRRQSTGRERRRNRAPLPIHSLSNLIRLRLADDAGTSGVLVSVNGALTGSSPVKARGGLRQVLSRCARRSRRRCSRAGPRHRSTAPAARREGQPRAQRGT